MNRPIRIRASFLSDLNAHIDWLREHRPSEQLASLRTGIREARALLGKFPSAGPIEGEADGAVLRKLLLRRVPYVIWYVDDGKSLWLLRLFHTRQDR